MMISMTYRVAVALITHAPRWTAQGMGYQGLWAMRINLVENDDPVDPKIMGYGRISVTRDMS